MQFREICLLQCNTIINTFWVDPRSELLKKVQVKPKNIRDHETRGGARGPDGPSLSASGGGRHRNVVDIINKDFRILQIPNLILIMAYLSIHGPILSISISSNFIPAHDLTG